MTLFRFLILLTAISGFVSCSRSGIPQLIEPLDQKQAFKNVCIDSAGALNSAYGPCEPSIAINPNKTEQLVAGAILNRVYRSADGGASWTIDQLDSPYGVFGDPVIRADYDNNFYYSHLSDPNDGRWTDPTILDRIVIQKSLDGGLQWNDGSYAGLHHPKDQDKQWMAVDPRNNHLYLTWTEFDKYDSPEPEDQSRILFSRSTDQGESWSTAIAINQFNGDCLDNDQTTEGAVPAVGPEGEIYVAWAWDEKIYFDRSLDGGETWLAEDILLADQPGGWTFDIPGIMRCNGMPVTAVDRSKGPHHGTIYVNWADQRNGGDDTDIWLARSSDGGDTWSEPLRVNTDPVGKHQFLSWLAVDQSTGFLYIVFYDRRNYEDLNTDVFLARSTDGGKSFENLRISATPFIPNPRVFFGDYNDISVEKGVVRPIWTRADNRRLSVWTALIDFSNN